MNEGVTGVSRSVKMRSSYTTIEGLINRIGPVEGTWCSSMWVCG